MLRISGRAVSFSSWSTIAIQLQVTCTEGKMDVIEGLMRFAGRLKNAKFLSYDVRHRGILPRSSRVTKLIVKDAHVNGNHTFGTNQTLATLSAWYLIISVREVIRKWQKECTESGRRKSRACHKNHGTTASVQT